jgi:hypothetical protein
MGHVKTGVEIPCHLFHDSCCKPCGGDTVAPRPAASAVVVAGFSNQPSRIREEVPL